jgi:hypothetical protein
VRFVPDGTRFRPFVPFLFLHSSLLDSPLPTQVIEGFPSRTSSPSSTPALACPTVLCTSRQRGVWSSPSSTSDRPPPSTPFSVHRTFFSRRLRFTSNVLVCSRAHSLSSTASSCSTFPTLFPSSSSSSVDAAFSVPSHSLRRRGPLVPFLDRSRSEPSLLSSPFLNTKTNFSIFQHHRPCLHPHHHRLLRLPS